MSGHNNYNTGDWNPQQLSSSTSGSRNTGLNPRYVPPQRRLVYHDGSGIERPTSAISNASFESQHPAAGGVSIDSLLNGDENHRYVQEFNPSTIKHSQHNQRNFAHQGDWRSQNGQSAQGAVNGVGFNATDEYGNVLAVARSGHHRGSASLGGDDFTHGSGGRHGQSFASGVATNNPFAALGAIGEALPSTGMGRLTSTRSSDSGHDSTYAGGTREAFELANLIRTGACEWGSEDDPAIYSERSRVTARNSHTEMTTTPLACPLPRPIYDLANAQLDPQYAPNLVSNRGTNIKGNAAIYLGNDIKPLPSFFLNVRQGRKPTIEEFFAHIPLIEACRVAAATSAGVIRIRNLPYGTPRSELTAFVGRNAQLVSMPEGSPYYSVHIIMERHTGKTMDGFIELKSVPEACYVVEQFNKRIQHGRMPRIGDRVVEVELSSQEDFMREMFPRAKNVVWDGPTPKIIVNNEEYYPGVPSSGFTGFLSSEEVVMVVKHVEFPHRSPFAQRAFVRVFESHISTLHKYPWFAHECVHMAERRLLFDCSVSLAKALIHIFTKKTKTSATGESLGYDKNPAQYDKNRPTEATLQELTVATLTCPGFSEQQKWSYIQVMVAGGYGRFSNSRGMNLKFGGTGAHAAIWPFQVLARDPTVLDDVVLYLASLLRESATAGEPLSLAKMHALRTSSRLSQGPFGNLSIDYGSAKTMCEVGTIEMEAVEKMLRNVLPCSSTAIGY